MAREIKEVAHLRTNIENYNSGYDRIFGKKDKQDCLREKEKCLHCNEPIPSNWVQQGGCHVGCYEIYINEEVLVWKVSLENSSYIHEDSSIDLTTLSDGETAQTVKLKRIDLMNMKEFTGF